MGGAGPGRPTAAVMRTRTAVNSYACAHSNNYYYMPPHLFLYIAVG